MNKMSIQDAFLNSARKNGVPVAIYVTNGYLINDAKIISLDNYVVLVEASGKQMLIYKHAISTVTPSERIDIESQIQEEQK